MPNFRFHFHMPDLPIEIQKYTVFSWGGHVGTALTRAWKVLRRVPVYSGKNMSTRLSHMNIDTIKLPNDRTIVYGLNGPGFIE